MEEKQTSVEFATHYSEYNHTLQYDLLRFTCLRFLAPEERFCQARHKQHSLTAPQRTTKSTFDRAKCGGTYLLPLLIRSLRQEKHGFNACVSILEILSQNKSKKRAQEDGSVGESAYLPHEPT